MPSCLSLLIWFTHLLTQLIPNTTGIEARQRVIIDPSDKCLVFLVGHFIANQYVYLKIENLKSIAADPGAGIGLVTIGLTVNYDHLINLLVFGWPFYSNLFNCEL